MRDFWLGSFQKRRFFFFSGTLSSQKIVKERAYILTSYQALLKAQFFLFSYSNCLYWISTELLKANKRYIEGSWLLFAAVFLLSLIFFNNAKVMYTINPPLADFILFFSK